MKPEKCSNMLADNARRISALVVNVPEEQARWKPDPESWSILEVVNHLLDEEYFDFRVRLEYTLFRPDDEWPTIDPQGWVTERQYNQRELGISLTGFLSARGESLAWLRTLSDPDWEAGHEVPWGRMRAGDLMASWVAHDLLHMRQLVELHWAYATQEVRPYNSAYAGEW